jgi:hypothetical protein
MAVHLGHNDVMGVTSASPGGYAQVLLAQDRFPSDAVLAAAAPDGMIHGHSIPFIEVADCPSRSIDNTRWLVTDHHTAADSKLLRGAAIVMQITSTDPSHLDANSNLVWSGIGYRQIPHLGNPIAEQYDAFHLISVILTHNSPHLLPKRLNLVL